MTTGRINQVTIEGPGLPRGKPGRDVLKEQRRPWRYLLDGRQTPMTRTGEVGETPRSFLVRVRRLSCNPVLTSFGHPLPPLFFTKRDRDPP
jgi:hypothetical protein